MMPFDQADIDNRMAQIQRGSAPSDQPLSRSQELYRKQLDYYKTFVDKAASASNPMLRQMFLRQAESVNPDSSQPLMQERMIAGQEEAADNYSANVDKTINEEVGQARSQLATQLSQGRRSLKSAENARGMLFSGRRLKGEGEMAAEAGGKLAQARGDTIRKVLGIEQDLKAKPIATRAGVSAQEAEQRGLLQGIKDNQAQQRAGYLSSGLGAIGTGAGLWLGNRTTPSADTGGGGYSSIGGGGSFPRISP